MKNDFNVVSWRSIHGEERSKLELRQALCQLAGLKLILSYNLLQACNGAVAYFYFQVCLFVPYISCKVTQPLYQ